MVELCETYDFVWLYSIHETEYIQRKNQNKESVRQTKRDLSNINTHIQIKKSAHPTHAN